MTPGALNYLKHLCSLDPSPETLAALGQSYGVALVAEVDRLTSQVQRVRAMVEQMMQGGDEMWTIELNDVLAALGDD